VAPRRPRLVAAAFSSFLALSGTAFATSVGALPKPVERIAHDAFAVVGLHLGAAGAASPGGAHPSPTTAPDEPRATDVRGVQAAKTANGDASPSGAAGPNIPATARATTGATAGGEVAAAVTHPRAAQTDAVASAHGAGGH
jgi:hypothetical protein